MTSKGMSHKSSGKIATLVSMLWSLHSSDCQANVPNDHGFHENHLQEHRKVGWFCPWIRQSCMYAMHLSWTVQKCTRQLRQFGVLFYTLFPPTLHPPQVLNFVFTLRSWMDAFYVLMFNDCPHKMTVHWHTVFLSVLFRLYSRSWYDIDWINCFSKREFFAFLGMFVAYVGRLKAHIEWKIVYLSVLSKFLEQCVFFWRDEYSRSVVCLLPTLRNWRRLSSVHYLSISKMERNISWCTFFEGMDSEWVWKNKNVNRLKRFDRQNSIDP